MGILEVQIENKFVAYAERDGAICIKMNLKGRRGWPDRLIIMEHGYCFFIEFKVPGAMPDKLQLHIHEKLKRKGHRVYVCDGFEEAVNAYEKEKVYAKKIPKAVNKVSNRQR